MIDVYSHPWQLLVGDALEMLRQIPDASVDCIVTSPPYWGQRDYGTGEWVGGDPSCRHAAKTRHQSPGKTSAMKDRRVRKAQREGAVYRSACRDCGAVLVDSQIGQEEHIDDFIAALVAVFEECRRVLKPTGTCWVNMGDKYATAGTRQRNSGGGIRQWIDGDLKKREETDPKGRGQGYRAKPRGFKDKDLIGQPWRLAFALQKAGWYLRSDVIWAKPSAKPESVKDRPTVSHEYVFLLTKSERYFYDAEAIAEPAVTFGKVPTIDEMPYGDHNDPELKEQGVARGSKPCANETRNARTVWTIPTTPYPGAHFATFPKELPTRCIKAGSSERGVCADCGRPYERVVERSTAAMSGSGKAGRSDEEIAASGKHGFGGKNGNATLKSGPVVSCETVGWRKTCRCDTDAVRSSVVLDPFAGSGTTLAVALVLGRVAVGIELKPDHAEQTKERLGKTPMSLFIAT